MSVLDVVAWLSKPIELDRDIDRIVPGVVKRIHGNGVIVVDVSVRVECGCSCGAALRVIEFFEETIAYPWAAVSVDALGLVLITKIRRIPLIDGAKRRERRA